MDTEQNTQNAEIQRLIDGKAARRREQASLPIEEKVQILVQLQIMNAELARQKGRPVEHEPWRL